MISKAYTGQEIAQGAKSGQWAALNKKNGATFNPTGGSALPSSASAAPNSSSNATTVSLQSVLPSERMLTADLGPAKIEYPENWQVMMPKQQGQFVTIAPQAGIAANGVGYGVVLNGVALRNGERMSIDGFTRQLVQDLQQNNGPRPVGGPQPIAVAGVQGRSVDLQSTSPFPATDGQPQKERDWLEAIS